MKKQTNSCHNSGFTFAEILVTIAIMAAVFPALLKVFSDTSRNLALTDNRMTALYLLKYKMEQIEMEGYPEVGQQSDVFGDNSIFEWQSNITEIQSEEIEGLLMVELTVSWEHVGKLQSISMFTYLSDREIRQTQN